MGTSGHRLRVAIALAWLALGALSPVARGDEAGSAGRGAWLGISTRNLSEAWRERNDYWTGGVMVVGVAPGGPADQAGIGPGDVLVSVGARSIREPADVGEAESSLEPGRAVSVVLARNGGRSIKIFNVEPGRSADSTGEGSGRPAGETVPVPPVALPEAGDAPRELVKESPAPAAEAPRGAAPETPPTAAADGSRSGATELGVRCQSLSPDLAEALGAPDEHGVLVLEVKGGGVADRAGIKSGDVIFKVGERPVEDVTSLDQAIAAAPSLVSISTIRRRTPQQVMVALTGHPAPGSHPALAEPAQGTGDAWRDRMLLELRDELQRLRREVQALRDELARALR